MSGWCERSFQLGNLNTKEYHEKNVPDLNVQTKYIIPLNKIYEAPTQLVYFSSLFREDVLWLK
jgi:hypothetical protein